MKIDEVYQNLNLVGNSAESSARKPDSNSETDSEAQEAQKASARVELSKTSVEVSKAAEMMETEPVDRMDKVNQLKERIESGTYEVDTKKVADSMLKEAILDFLKL